MTWTIIISVLTGGLAGSFLTQICNHIRNRLQKVQCAYIEDDIQSKVPVQINKMEYSNLYFKKYQLKNTTNMDINKFSVRFVFDLNSSIIDYSNHTKAGEGKANVTVKGNKRNECILRVKDFNRGDKVDVTLRIANITENAYYITEMDSVGFKLKIKDKRKKQDKTSSRFSYALR